MNYAAVRAVLELVDCIQRNRGRTLDDREHDGKASLLSAARPSDVHPGEPSDDVVDRDCNAPPPIDATVEATAAANEIFQELRGHDVLVVMQADQLNILGQTFRPVFTGTLADVQTGFIELNPVIIKMPNAPFFRFPTPLCFPIERIDNITPFDSGLRFPIS